MVRVASLEINALCTSCCCIVHNLMLLLPHSIDAAAVLDPHCGDIRTAQVSLSWERMVGVCLFNQSNAGFGLHASYHLWVVSLIKSFPSKPQHKDRT